FVPVEGQENAYNIQRMSTGMFVGSDNKWTSTPISRNIPLSQHAIEVSSVDENYITLRNLGQASNGKCMGTDNTEAGSSVYTDKAGTDAAKHLWFIEPADLYPSETEEPEDFYAEYELPDDERATAYEGYRLVFAQEFSTDGTPDHDIWNFEEGFKRNNEDQYYNSDKNCYIKDGVLVIEGRNVESEKIKNPKYDPFNKAWPSSIGKYLTWTSGSMQTKGSWNSGYTWNYGIYEVRAKVPQYVGSWPAIWSTGMQYEWPYGGEIDIMEYYGNRIHATVCWGNGNRWAGAWNSATVHDNVLGAGWGDEYHIWRMVWDYDHMELWCDDILVNNINLDTTQNAIPDADYDHGNGCNPFRDVRHMLWLNLALGGNNGGSLANTPRPLRYLVDYARVYQKIGTDGKATYSVDPEISEPTFNIKDGEETGISNVTLDPEAPVTGVYNLQGIRVADDTESLRGTGQVYIVVRGKASEKVIL
ncbi:MAG: family 16 glycosylhydrolase, partial [Muribaculaceae bacterium]|nr:family 16 glycosylhydrolase [Muribaculaceae bacterium]